MDTEVNKKIRIAVVIPCYRVTRHVVKVIQDIPSFVSKIYVVDDACPDCSGEHVSKHCKDSRVQVLNNPENQGVGGAVMAGYQAAINEGMDIIVKIDGDGQMDPLFIPALIYPIMAGEADYTKGNRFYNLEGLHAMPKVRLLGNAVLSLMCKLSSGYWNLFDPTNGYTAIHAEVARHLPFHKIGRRYFFETDMLFRLNTLRAVVADVPMEAQYGDEVSNLKISRVSVEFFAKHMRNYIKRIFYNYYLRDMSLASFELPVAIVFLVFGLVFGGWHWIASTRSGVLTSAGTVMLSALPILAGIQFLVGFISYDIASVPVHPIFRRYLGRAWRRSDDP
jgi:dolichol-phosphate mannosyltransferase